MKHLLTIMVVAIVAIAMLTVFCTGSAKAEEITWPEPNWQGIFEPNQLLTLNLEMDPCDWNDIRLNGMLWDDVNEIYYTPDDPNIYELEVPAWFWMDGEDANKIVVAVRQKSCDPLGDANDRYFKISLKIDINQYYGTGPGDDPNAATDWHGLKKLSLENGDDVDVLAECAAVNLHRMGAGSEGYGYDNWCGSMVKLYVNGVCKGVYVNAEQHDKQFLRNRDIYISHNSWLYKYWGEGDYDLKVGDDDYPVSPAVEALCYEPFVNIKTGSPLYPTGGICPEPNDTILVADMNEWVNMQALLAMASINALVANPDALFSHYNNAYFFDFNLYDIGETRKRMYFAWDQDSIMNSIDWNLYRRGGGETMWQRLILGCQPFHMQFNQITKALLTGPLSEVNIHAFLDDINTPEIRAAVGADQFNNLDGPGEFGVIERFGQIEQWYSDRIANSLDQVLWDEPPGTILLWDGFEQTAWDADWNDIAHNWLEDNTTYYRGYASAAANKDNDGYFTCDPLDASDATAIHIGFWFMKDKDVGTGDLLLYYYNGTSYNQIVDIYTLNGKNEWLHYTDVITDSQYFDPNFSISFEAVASYNKEEVWIDDVVVSKLITTPVSPVISGYILDPKGAPIEGVSVSANDGGGSDTTDPNGYYEVIVPYGWSNSAQNWSSTITPTKTDYTFDPAQITYSNVIVDREAHDYKGTSIYDLVADGYINFKDLEIFVASWLSGPGDGNWNPACDFYADLHIDFKDFAKFALAWQPQ